MYPLLKRLNDEWSDLAAISDSPVSTWAVDAAGAGSTLDDVLAWITREPDSALHFLITRAQTGDRLAARTVLQTMLGKLVRVSVQVAQPGLTQHAAFTELTCQMCVTIAGYPLSTRPTKVAANLWMDCLKQARTLWSLCRPGRAPEPSYSPEDVAWLLDHHIYTPTVEEEWTNLDARDVIESARHLGLIAPDAADLLAAVYGPHGLSGEVAAQLWGITPAAVRTRCRRAINTLAESAEALLAA